MESNINNLEAQTDEQLDEPRFDEESTLLSARPVVPLNEVKTKERSTRRIVVASVLIAALMLGVFAATIVYKQLAENRSTAVSDSGTADPALSQPAAANEPGGASNNPDPGVAAATSEEPQPVKSQEEDAKSTSDEVTTVRNRTSTSSPASAVRPAGRNQPDPAEIDATDEDERLIRRAERREARRLQRIEEREARKAAKRETRAAKGQSDDDLLRIREIFEGSPRP